MLSPNGAFVLAQQSQGDQFSQEIKVTGDARDGFLKYVGGLYYFREDYTTEVADVAHRLHRRRRDAAAQVPRAYIDARLGRPADREHDAFLGGLPAGRLQVHRPVDGTVGLRYTDETKTVGVTDLRDPRAIPVVGGVRAPTCASRPRTCSASASRPRSAPRW